MRLISIVLLLLITGITEAETISYAKYQRQFIKSISVVAPAWDDYTNRDGTGLYWDILRAIYEPIGIKVKTKTVPWNRAMKMVSKYRTYNAIVGEYRSSVEPILFPDFPIDVDYLSVLSKEGTASQWQGTESMAGKKVGWIKDYNSIPEAQRDFTLKEFRNIEQGIKMLNSGELDFVIDSWDEISAAMQSYALNKENYNVNQMSEGKNLYTVFSDDNLSRELIKIYNERIPLLFKSGELATLYKKWGTGEIPEEIMALTY